MGTSMGGATVLMMTGTEAAGTGEGCGFRLRLYFSQEVFTHVLHSMYHLPAFPLIPLADRINRKKAGYGLDDCNAAREVRKGSCSGADDPRGQRYFRSLLDVRCNL